MIKTYLKNLLKNSVFILGVVSLIIFTIIQANNDYLEYKVVNCTVIDKLQSSGSYKHHGYFYLVLRDERGVNFDLIVSPATYSQASVNEHISFNLREMDIQQSFKNNLIYFFGSVVFCVIGFVCFFAGLFFNKELSNL